MENFTPVYVAIGLVFSVSVIVVYLHLNHVNACLMTPTLYDKAAQKAGGSWHPRHPMLVVARCHARFDVVLAAPHGTLARHRRSQHNRRVGARSWPLSLMFPQGVQS